VQEASHFVLQSALGGVTSHLASHRPAHVDSQDDWQRLSPDAQLAPQLALQSARHEAAQLNLPGSTWHCVAQDALQLVVQLASTFTVHLPSQPT